MRVKQSRAAANNTVDSSPAIKIHSTKAKNMAQKSIKKLRLINPIFHYQFQMIHLKSRESTIWKEMFNLKINVDRGVSPICQIFFTRDDHTFDRSNRMIM